MDIALAIEALLPAAEYYGSTTANNKDCFDNLDWQDSRPKPTWEQVQNGYVQAQAEAEAKATARQALLNKLGITAEEAKLLLGGN